MGWCSTQLANMAERRKQHLLQTNRLKRGTKPKKKGKKKGKKKVELGEQATVELKDADRSGHMLAKQLMAVPDDNQHKKRKEHPEREHNNRKRDHNSRDNRQRTHNGNAGDEDQNDTDRDDDDSHE